ncbi:MAG: lipopolysaccharide heptosyltransferase I [Pseudohongiellaceae bacterium]
MRVLIVKMSSMGDIIHTLPALTDARRLRPDLRFDWVVEEAFTEIPGWHPAVDRVIPVAIRRWRGSLMTVWRNGEFRAFRRSLRTERYDLVIDAQGLIKSGIVSRISRGLTVGLSNSTIREPLATLFYNRRISVPRDMHAVERVRELFARALNYNHDRRLLDYGLRLPPGTTPWPEQDPGRPVLVFFHGTTWHNKHWPEAMWKALLHLSTEKGFRVLLPWGSSAERDRVGRLAAGDAHASVLPRMSLTELARTLERASGVVAVDTGLAHLAAALDVPAVVLYGPTDPALAGTHGRHQHHLCSSLECAPCLKRRCHYQGDPLSLTLDGQAVQVQPPCFSTHPPAAVLDRLLTAIRGAGRTVPDSAS